MILSTLLALLSMWGNGHPLAPPAATECASAEHREIVMYGRIDPHEVAPLMMRALGRTPVRIGWPRIEPIDGGIAAIDEAGHRYTATWHCMPQAVVLVLSREPGASPVVLDTVKHILGAVSDSRYTDEPAPCLMNRP